MLLRVTSFKVHLELTRKIIVLVFRVSFMLVYVRMRVAPVVADSKASLSMILRLGPRLSGAPVALRA